MFHLKLLQVRIKFHIQGIVSCIIILQYIFFGIHTFYTLHMDLLKEISRSARLKYLLASVTGSSLCPQKLNHQYACQLQTPPSSFLHPPEQRLLEVSQTGILLAPRAHNRTSVR